jgi:hypothetical protein
VEFRGRLVNNELSGPLEIKSEEQLWRRIDHSVSQADAGIGEEADLVIDELLGQFVG